jgi:ketosteroid isomerase-like protein
MHDIISCMCGSIAECDIEANKALVREFFRRWSAVDLDGMCELTDPDGIYWMITFGEDLRFEDWTDRVKRKRQLFREPPRFELQYVTAEADRVSVVARGYSVLEDGTPDGVRYDNVYHWLFQIRDGRLTSAREFCDPRLSDAVFREGQCMTFEVSP